MSSLLSRLFGRSNGTVVSDPKEEEAYSIFKPEEQLIYSFWNGKEMVRADPQVLYRRMMEVSSDLGVDLKVAQSISKDAGKARELAVTKIRKIFQIEPLSQDAGLTEQNTMDLFDHFLTFLGVTKKSSSPSQTLQTPSADSSSSSATGVSPTSSSSESGSTVAESPIVEPTPSPKE